MADLLARMREETDASRGIEGWRPVQAGPAAPIRFAGDLGAWVLHLPKGAKPVVIGRQVHGERAAAPAETDVVEIVAPATVSRYHVKITRQGDEYVVEPSDADCPVAINGVLIQPRTIRFFGKVLMAKAKPGDVLTLPGDVNIMLGVPKR